MSKKEPLKVGDRVAVYDGQHRITGVIVDHPTNTARCFRVNKDPQYGDWDMYNRKQCYRLNKKPKRKSREIWVNEYPWGIGNAVWASKQLAEDNRAVRQTGVARFREVLPKKGNK